MHIGIPKEVKIREGRVGLIPEACADLVRAGHRVLLEMGAGAESGYSDALYRNVGVEIMDDAESLYGSAQLIVKVKEPQAQDLALLNPSHTLFCYLHLAAEPALARRLQEIGVTAIAFETVEQGGALPLLRPMSEIAGRLSVQAGAHLLQLPQGGRGVLLGSLPAAPRGRVVVIGAGSAGGAAVALAAAMGANVIVFDRKWDRLEAMRALGANVTALYPYADRVAQAVAEADLLVGAVLVAGDRAPNVVDAATVARMAPGTVIADISVDQGGCIETTRPTNWDQPTYTEHGVVHFAVTNMPGAVPRTASQALSANLIPYVHALAEETWEAHPELQSGLNVRAGEIVHPVVRRALAMDAKVANN